MARAAWANSVPRSREPWQRATACSRLLVTTMPLIIGTSERMAASCSASAVEWAMISWCGVSPATTTPRAMTQS
jgi:hypothetical protein